MQIGINLPQVGQLASPASVRATAVAAEAAGYSSLWVFDRILGAVEPRSAYPGAPDGRMPEDLATVLDPIGTLTYAAAVTERVRLGTSVLVAPWYQPVLLARALTTLDLFSEGRLTVGFGTGWSLDEYESVNVPMRERGARLDETLDVLEAIWTTDPVSFEGRFSRIVPSTIAPKPAQAGGPPIILGAFSPTALDRIARRAAGWNPVGLPFEFVEPMWATVLELAAGHGRDPESLRMVMRANIVLTDSPIDGAERSVFTGSVEQVAEDIERARSLGTHELVLGVGIGLRRSAEVLEQLDLVATTADLPVGSLLVPA